MTKFILMISVTICLLVGCTTEDTIQIDGLPIKDTTNGQWQIINTRKFPGQMIGHKFSTPPSLAVNGLFFVTTHTGYKQIYQISQPSHPVSERYFKHIGYFLNQVTIAQEQDNSPFIVINKEGKNIATLKFPDHNLIMAHNFSEGMALIGTSLNRFGYVDTQGKLAIPPIYEYATDFCEGKAIVGQTDTKGRLALQVINKKGETLFHIQQSGCIFSSQYQEDKLGYQSLATGQCGYLDTKGNPLLYLPSTIKGATGFKHNMAVCYTDAGYGIINEEGGYLLSPVYKDIQILTKNIVAVKENIHWEILHIPSLKKGNAKYQEAPYYLGHNLLIAHLGKNYILMDSNEHIYAEIPIYSTDIKSLFNLYQVFTRSLSPNRIKSKADSTYVNNNKPDKTLKNQSPKVTSVPQVLPAQNWQHIAKTNPFYKEAQKIFSGKLQEEDCSNRKMILDYVEHFRTSYTTKDIDFLKQLFSEDALIIVGKVIKQVPKETESMIFQKQIVYSLKSKQEYLKRLESIFKANKKIEVAFSDFQIMRHPGAKDIYGVTLHQKYRSDLYSDEGYIFLLWDFREPTAPKIHVRTWQPQLTDEKTPLQAKDIINISLFNFN